MYHYQSHLLADSIYTLRHRLIVLTFFQFTRKQTLKVIKYLLYLKRFCQLPSSLMQYHKTWSQIPAALNTARLQSQSNAY